MQSFFSRIKGKKLNIGFLGLGKSNTGILDFLRGLGFDFNLTVRSDKDFVYDETLLADRIFKEQNVLDCIDEDYLFLSPSVRRDRSELAYAKAHGTTLSSDAELFFSHTDKDIFAVTGSDGKSTTTFLISKMLSSEKTKYEAAGNFGKSLTPFLKSSTVPVAELSSFQLMYMKPKTKRAVITNITPNHLNWHTSLFEYINAKKNIFENSDGIVLDVDSEILRDNLPKKKLFCAVSDKFSLHFMLKHFNSENYITKKDSLVFLNGKPLFDTREATRRESYNVKNFMLAAGTVFEFSNYESILNTVKSFSGLPHRAELIATKNGISYINSSIDSSPERTLKTLRAIKSAYNSEGEDVPRVCVIIGGLGKGLDTKPLAQELPSLSIAAVLLGEVGNEIYSLLKKENSKYRFVLAQGMEDAVRKAESFVFTGGAVLLSPAATSFDSYRNFEERGEDFKRIITEKNSY